ncbi:putative endonuclease-reverse transcriptase [Trichonephila clavipes]|nr:putative endonuclease-reverse transcriptase [Trichonephila clavipes]
MAPVIQVQGLGVRLTIQPHKKLLLRNLKNRGNIFNKSTQLLAFADDIDIFARTPTALRQALLYLEKEALMGLTINENKTKYMPCTKSSFNKSHFKIEEYSFEVVDSFTYLGSEINNRNYCTTEIQKRITMTNRCLNGIRKYIKSNLIQRKTKVLFHKSLLSSVLTYAYETWSMSRTDENMISIYERKILR